MAEITVQEESSTPSTPSSGKWKIYTKSGGLYILEDTGTETGPLGTGGGGGISDGDKGDITVSGSGTVWTIDDGVITLAKWASGVLDTDVALAANSDSKVPSQKAVKAYVDSLTAGLKWKQTVKAATTTNGTLATDYENGDTIDGVTLATGDRILLKDQTTGSENGIYTVNASGAPTRATDADSGTELVSAAVFVEQGTVNADKAFVCTNDSIIIDSTSITFTAFASVVGALIAANNLSDLTNTGTARTNLGLGDAATKSVGTGASDVAAGNRGVTNGDSHDHNGGDGAAIVEAAITLADNTTNDVSTTKHGFAPKLPNDSSKFLNGQGGWTTPAGGGSSKGRVEILVATVPLTSGAPIAGLDGASSPAEGFAYYSFVNGSVTYRAYKCRLIGYQGGGLTFKFEVLRTSAGAGSTYINEAAIRRINTGTEDLGASHSYDYNAVTITIPAGPPNAGIPMAGTISFTDGADMDNLSDGDLFWLVFRRNGGTATDTERVLLSLTGEET